MINQTETKVIFEGDGSTVEFPFSFPFAKKDDVHVLIADEDTGAETVLERDYYIDVEKGAVIYPGYVPGEEPAETERPPVLAKGKRLVVYRVTPVTQETDLGEKYPLPIIETMVDKLTMAVQEQSETLVRTVKISKSSTETADDLMQTLYDGRDKAVASAAAAAESETNAKASEANAAESAESAAKSAEEAKNVSSIEDAIDKSEATLRGEIEDSKTELTDAINAKIAELEKKIAEKNESQMTNLSYAQVTKLNTVQYKGVAIPIAENTSYVHPPFEVLKLRDDGVSETSTMCEFSNGDASDFAYDDASAVIFSRGAMRLGTTFNAAMSEPVELVDGHVSESALIDLANWKSVLEVDVR